MKRLFDFKKQRDSQAIEIKLKIKLKHSFILILKVLKLNIENYHSFMILVFGNFDSQRRSTDVICSQRFHVGLKPKTNTHRMLEVRNARYLLFYIITSAFVHYHQPKSKKNVFSQKYIHIHILETFEKKLAISIFLLS